MRRRAVRIDVVYNLGAGNFLRPTRLRLLNNGDDKAAAQFPRWDLANRILLPGLRRRREAEAEFFSSVTAVGRGRGVAVRESCECVIWADNRRTGFGGYFKIANGRLRLERLSTGLNREGIPIGVDF